MSSTGVISEMEGVGVELELATAGVWLRSLCLPLRRPLGSSARVVIRELVDIDDGSDAVTLRGSGECQVARKPGRFRPCFTAGCGSGWASFSLPVAVDEEAVGVVSQSSRGRAARKPRRLVLDDGLDGARAGHKAASWFRGRLPESWGSAWGSSSLHFPILAPQNRCAGNQKTRICTYYERDTRHRMNRNEVATAMQWCKWSSHTQCPYLLLRSFVLRDGNEMGLRSPIVSNSFDRFV